MAETILYATDGPVATITLNRPEQLNTIVPPMPDEVEAAVGRAVRDGDVKVIVLRGAGRSFCAGYDFGGGFEALGRHDHHRRRVGPGQGLRVRHRARALADPEAHERLALAEAGDRPGARLVRRRRQRLRALRRPRDRLARTRRSARPTRACGAPTCRGCGSTGSGSTRAKYHALTGRPLSGREAADGRADQRGGAVRRSSRRRVARARGRAGRRCPSSQLAAMKLVVNHAYENMGLASTQTLGPILDGLMRNTPEALALHRARRARGRARGGRPSATGRSATTARRRPSGGRTRTT